MGCSDCSVDRLNCDHTGGSNVCLGRDRCVSSKPEGGAILNDECKDTRAGRTRLVNSNGEVSSLEDCGVTHETL